MLKIKCKDCGYSNVYENEKHAYMDGWFWVGPKLAITICWRCGRAESSSTNIKKVVDKV
jgi:predicted nucleic-acid-binding Zn-ribbon protein